MSQPGESNGGFRWQEVSRAQFQRVTAQILGEHKAQIDGHAAKVRAQGEFMADMSVRLDGHEKQLQAHQDAFSAWAARTFLERLRWLCLGR